MHNSRRQRTEDTDIKRIDNIKQEIHAMYEDVCQKMSKHDEVTTQYKEKQEQYFLKTFTTMMEKLSDELKIAKDKYQNIDIEIERDDRIVKLQKEVYFFREECLVLTDEIKKLKTQNSRLLKLTHQLKEQKIQQYLILLKKTKKEKKDQAIIERKNSLERPATSLQCRVYINQQKYEAVTGASLNMNNRTSKHAKSISKTLTTRPKSDADSSTARLLRSKKVNKKNQLLQIWENCIKQAKGTNQSKKYFAKQTKLNTLQNFFSIDKVFELLTCKIFDTVCCNNPQCKTNISDPLLDTEFVKPTIDSRPSTQMLRTERNKPYYNPYRKFRQNQPLTLQNNFTLGQKNRYDCI